MKFKNDTGKSQKYRLGSYKSGFEWHTVKVEEIIDIPENIAVELKLTKIKELSEVINNEPTIKNSEDVDAVFQSEQNEKTKVLYKAELIAIKGLGPKSAKQIIKDYPTKEKLIKAIKNNKEIHKHDGINKAVKETFLSD